MDKAVAGIVSGEWSYNDSRYYIEALNFYEEVIYIDPFRVTYSLGKNSRSVQINYEGSFLNNLSMLYTFGYGSEILLLVKCLQLCGCPTSDPYHVISRDSLGKLSDLLGLVELGVGTSTHVLPSVDAAVKYIEDLDVKSYPLLRKPIAGNKGKCIQKLENREEALRACKSHFNRNDSTLVFEKFMEYQHEYRVYVVDGAPVEAYEKVKKDVGIVRNLHPGDSAIAVEDEQLKQILFEYASTCVKERFDLGIFGLDLALTETGSLHVIKIDRISEFNDLNRLGLLNLPRHAHEVIHKRSRRSKFTGTDDRTDHVIAFLGDSNPGDSYQEKREARGRKNILKQKGYEYSFQKFRDLLACSDYTVANLEVSVTEHCESELAGIKPYVDRAAVKETTALLKSLGINAVSLANNHTKDFGEIGLVDTIGAMQEGGIEYFGAGQTATEAECVVHHHVSTGNKFLHIVFAGGFEYRSVYRKWGYYADARHPGVNLWSSSNARRQISALREQYPKAFIIAFPHWGYNYKYLSQKQNNLARILCDSGADIVIGHGSHMLQEIVRYKGKWVVYSLGNFVFNSPGRFAQYDVLPYGLIGQLNFRHKKDKIACALQLYPIRSDNKKTNHQPDFVSQVEFDRVMNFYMPTKNPSYGIQPFVKSGKDKWGYYLSLDVVVPQ